MQALQAINYLHCVLLLLALSVFRKWSKWRTEELYLILLFGILPTLSYNTTLLVYPFMGNQSGSTKSTLLTFQMLWKLYIHYICCNFSWGFKNLVSFSGAFFINYTEREVKAQMRANVSFLFFLGQNAGAEPKPKSKGNIPDSWYRYFVQGIFHFHFVRGVFFIKWLPLK